MGKIGIKSTGIAQLADLICLRCVLPYCDESSRFCIRRTGDKMNALEQKKRILAMYSPEELRRIFTNRLDDEMFSTLGAALGVKDDDTAAVWKGFEYLLDIDAQDGRLAAMKRASYHRRKDAGGVEA